MFVIDGPAVVGVYQAEIPDFSSLVKIGTPGEAIFSSVCETN